MQVRRREALPVEALPGRFLQRAVGAEGPLTSGCMSVGFARYCAEAGVMQPHAHAEETVVVLSSQDGWVRCGPSADRLGEAQPVSAGTVLHIPPGEWHAFGFSTDGHVDICFCYGQATAVRPEDQTPQES